jgi:hypothetical protein
MATLSTLCEDGLLREIDPGLEHDELPTRRLYGTPEFVIWLDKALPNVPADPLQMELSAMEQVFAVFREYLLGEDFCDDRRFKKLSNNPDHHVWEFKTDDIRIFGWVPEKDAFVCCFGDTKNDIETFKKYGKYIALTKYTRDQLDLSAPKYVEGREYLDVLSAQNRR